MFDAKQQIKQTVRRNENDSELNENSSNDINCVCWWSSHINTVLHYWLYPFYASQVRRQKPRDRTPQERALWDDITLHTPAVTSFPCLAFLLHCFRTTLTGGLITINFEKTYAASFFEIFWESNQHESTNKENIINIYRTKRKYKIIDILLLPLLIINKKKIAKNN